MIGAKLICENKWGLNCEKTANDANNDDMPKGGEFQGIDNVVELQSKKRNSKILDEKSGLCEPSNEKKEFRGFERKGGVGTRRERKRERVFQKGREKTHSTIYR